MSPTKPFSLTPPQTQSSQGGKSSTVYRWVILFLYNEDTEFPFTCVPLTALENSNFPFNAINGSMDANLRMQPIQISSLNGNHLYCIFAKIEDGMFFNLIIMLNFQINEIDLFF